MDKELGNEPKSPDGLALAASLLAALGTTEQEITDTWVAASNPPTQLLGRAAYENPWLLVEVDRRFHGETSGLPATAPDAPTSANARKPPP